MGFFSKIFSGKPEEADKTSEISAHDPATEVTPMDNTSKYEKYLEQSFGLKLENGGWVFEGGKIIDDMVQQFSQPGICIDVLKAIKTKTAFSKVCIVPGDKMVILVCDTKPAPVCFVSGLTAKGIAEILSSAIITGGEKTYEYKGTWIVAL